MYWVGHCKVMVDLLAGSVMQLLTHLQRAATSAAVDSSLLIQRLWPFFRHPIASVRLAAVRLFANLVASPAGKRSQMLLHCQKLDAGTWVCLFERVQNVCLHKSMFLG